jgi:MFS superfamily sulfate permease-like transporter
MRIPPVVSQKTVLHGRALGHSPAVARIPGAFRLDPREVAGSLGDLGTFLPLLVAMASQNGLDFASGLFFAGVFNVVTGLLFGIPMAVQPMKAIAAVALTQGLPAPQIVAAGASVSLFVLLLGATGLVQEVDRWVPRCIVRGVQLFLGLSLVMKGAAMVAATRAFFPDGYATAAVSLVVAIGLSRSRRVPAALVLFAIGVVIVFAFHRMEVRQAAPTLWLPTLRPPAWVDFRGSFLRAAVPQLPLTTLNSVVAVAALSRDLFPARPASVRRVSISVGVMNLVGAWFGAMPMCHGAGGLAAQYRFGARTGASIVLLGVAKASLAVLFGASLMGVCRAFPGSVLGVMLAVGGLELSLAARDVTTRRDLVAMLATVGVALGLNNLGAGFVAGIVVFALSPRDDA